MIVDEIIWELRKRGIRAESAHTPSVLSVPLDGALMLIALHHNWEGWEAVIDTNGDQRSLKDGPPMVTTLTSVVNWIEDLYADPLGSLA